jgi:hypothetical protein
LLPVVDGPGLGLLDVLWFGMKGPK